MPKYSLQYPKLHYHFWNSIDAGGTIPSLHSTPLRILHSQGSMEMISTPLHSIIRSTIPCGFRPTSFVSFSYKVKNSLARYCLLRMLVEDININDSFFPIITQDAFSIVKSIQDASMALSKNASKFR